MIKITGLKKVYAGEAGGVTALEDINIEIKRGNIFGIIGLSGAGKSTLIRCMNLLERPTAGTVKIDGQDITTLQGAELGRLRRSMGMIFQHFNLLMQRTVERNIAFPLEIAGVHKKEIKKRVEELLELVGLSEKAGSYPSQLSGGQKQRVAIARALANNPKVLLCDEATSALDPMTTRSILGLLKDINRKLGITIVIITHEMSVITEICDHVAVIDYSRIVEEGPVIDVVTAPKSEPARKLFGQSVFRDIRSGDIATTVIGEYGLRIKVRFTGEAAMRPVISEMVLQFGVYANILYGKVDYIQGKPVGDLVLELSGGRNEIVEAVGYLRGQGLFVEDISA
jgi:D-methionine transport system ATP-binding protein